MKKSKRSHSYAKIALHPDLRPNYCSRAEKRIMVFRTRGMDILPRPPLLTMLCTHDGGVNWPDGRRDKPLSYYQPQQHESKSRLGPHQLSSNGETARRHLASSLNVETQRSQANVARGFTLPFVVEDLQLGLFIGGKGYIFFYCLVWVSKWTPTDRYGGLQGGIFRKWSSAPIVHPAASNF